MRMLYCELVLYILAMVESLTQACEVTHTTVSGTRAPSKMCAGDLIFNEEFEEFDLEVWQHEITLSGGGNWEFQYYNNNRSNSFTRDGNLVIRPTLTSDQFGEDFLYSGTLNVDGGAPAERCTNPTDYGCERTGTPTNILNPIKSARIRTVESFNFRYGRVEVRAKMPVGDWLWPSVWLMPTHNAYGEWPASGEIDLVESRGNRLLYQDSINIGTQRVTSTLHFGPDWSTDAYRLATWSKQGPGFDEDFHLYQLEWTPDHMTFSVDDIELGTISPGNVGFWHIGGFNGINMDNPWRYGSKMAPFDQKFYIIINLAVGGTNGYFPDEATSPRPKPWSNTSPRAMTYFWKKRNDWLGTWALNKEDGAALQIDYVRVWAI